MWGGSFSVSPGSAAGTTRTDASGPVPESCISSRKAGHPQLVDLRTFRVLADFARFKTALVIHCLFA